jgi:hypothetical protein
LFIKLLTSTVLIKLLDPEPDPNPNQEQKFRIRIQQKKFGFRSGVGFESTTLELYDLQAVTLELENCR